MVSEDILWKQKKKLMNVNIVSEDIYNKNKKEGCKKMVLGW